MTGALLRPGALHGMVRYAIVERSRFGGTSAEQDRAMVAHAVRLAGSGVDYLQLRSKDEPFERARALAEEAHRGVVAAGCGTRVLLNADWRGAAEWPAQLGLHLSTSALRSLGADAATLPGDLPGVVSASCHDLAELDLARRFATVVLFAPVFEKRVDGRIVQDGRGVQALAAVCRAAGPLPVLAMGGVTMENAAECLWAGARGVAGIRLFA